MLNFVVDFQSSCKVYLTRGKSDFYLSKQKSYEASNMAPGNRYEKFLEVWRLIAKQLGRAMA